MLGLDQGVGVGAIAGGLDSGGVGAGVGAGGVSDGAGAGVDVSSGGGSGGVAQPLAGKREKSVARKRRRHRKRRLKITHPSNHIFAKILVWEDTSTR